MYVYYTNVLFITMFMVHLLVLLYSSVYLSLIINAYKHYLSVNCVVVILFFVFYCTWNWLKSSNYHEEVKHMNMYACLCCIMICSFYEDCYYIFCFFIEIITVKANVNNSLFLLKYETIFLGIIVMFISRNQILVRQIISVN